VELTRRSMIYELAGSNLSPSLSLSPPPSISTGRRRRDAHGEHGGIRTRSRSSSLHPHQRTRRPGNQRARARLARGSMHDFPTSALSTYVVSFDPSIPSLTARPSHHIGPHFLVNLGISFDHARSFRFTRLAPPLISPRASLVDLEGGGSAKFADYVIALLSVRVFGGARGPPYLRALLTALIK